ncbi:hypothetical protein C7M84_014907 [Penaeus vannamei]|uniref:Uncharacterized protein n=1 Tax=Penaeus vannamei TaxID=6689 RepID=A0A423SS72_PENVA|nr:hypothetical protein C7M84_014907 [Penaeus vannamei]
MGARPSPFRASFHARLAKWALFPSLSLLPLMAGSSSPFALPPWHDWPIGARSSPFAHSSMHASANHKPSDRLLTVGGVPLSESSRDKFITRFRGLLSLRKIQLATRNAPTLTAGSRFPRVVAPRPRFQNKHAKNLYVPEFKLIPLLTPPHPPSTHPSPPHPLILFPLNSSLSSPPSTLFLNPPLSPIPPPSTPHLLPTSTSSLKSPLPIPSSHPYSPYYYLSLSQLLPTSTPLLPPQSTPLLFPSLTSLQSLFPHPYSFITTFPPSYPSPLTPLFPPQPPALLIPLPSPTPLLLPPKNNSVCRIFCTLPPSLTLPSRSLPPSSAPPFCKTSTCTLPAPLSASPSLPPSQRDPAPTPRPRNGCVNVHSRPAGHRLQLGLRSAAGHARSLARIKSFFCKVRSEVET